MSEYIQISSNPAAQTILNGFRLISLKLKNASTGQVAWVSRDWSADVFTVVKEAHLPTAMLTFPAVGREIVFSTTAAIRNFRIDCRAIPFLVSRVLSTSFESSM
jgi:hypothetical protein